MSRRHTTHADDGAASSCATQSLSRAKLPRTNSSNIKSLVCAHMGMRVHARACAWF